MGRYIYILCIGLLALLMGSCKKYEPFPAEQRTIEFAFNPQDSLGNNAYAFLNGVYSFLPNGHNRIAGSDYLDAASGDAISSGNSTTSEIYNLSTGAYNSSSIPQSENVWGQYYSGIRKANFVINNVLTVPVKQEVRTGISMKYAWRNEARFLRALFYFELLKRYGGITLVGNKIFDVTSDLNLPRNSFEECVNYIVNECDAIKDTMLTAPLANPNLYSQRATNGAALALKAKVLLYAASPLFNGGNIDGGNPLTGYTSYSADRWAKAAAAAKAVMDLNAYSLVSGLNNAFITQVPANTETIFSRAYGIASDIERKNGPIGFSTNPPSLGNTSPTQNLVDAFPMANGLAITAAGSGYNPANPYANRDPRLAATVFCNGAPWLNGTVQTFEGGRSKPNNGTQQTTTGYYMRKFMGPYENQSTFGGVPEDWHIFRYADVLLSYAEAQNEFLSSPDVSVYTAVEQIRKRAGLTTYQLPAGLTRDAMRAVIQNERRLELAFEENRYFDIRRWKTAESILNQPRRGVQIINDPVSGLSYNYVTAFNSKFIAPKMYLSPIPFDEIRKASNLKQNPGW
ncbi:RagB/SusD family nutrient uptake outer membrane protein [Mucilaginibacter sp. CSA2-8R]|uniref:RagB/SusD family nutrient uptake outer membrane protein n=1 Tax=Mucilaginibacter sp. CSA2-8R TaxID=3141542 RepID=UPI00315CA096